MRKDFIVQVVNHNAYLRRYRKPQEAVCVKAIVTWECPYCTDVFTAIQRSMDEPVEIPCPRCGKIILIPETTFYVVPPNEKLV